MRVSLAVLAGAVLAAAALAAADGAVSKTKLTITVWPEGRGAAASSRTWTLRCHPPGGTHPGARAACQALVANRAALRPVPPGTVCTMIYGGPQEAEIRGVLRGKRIRAVFNRQGGCEIARWDRLRAVFLVRVGL